MRSPTSAIQNGRMLANTRKANVKIQQFPCESWQVQLARLPDLPGSRRTIDAHGQGREPSITEGGHRLWIEE